MNQSEIDQRIQEAHESGEYNELDQPREMATVDSLFRNDDHLEAALLGKGVYDLIRLLDAAVTKCDGDIYTSDARDVRTVSDRACELVKALRDELHTEALRINAELGL